VGSPLTEECPIGFAPGLEPIERAAAFRVLLDGMDRYAAASRIPILALKDVTDRDAMWATKPLERAGFTRVATLPLASPHLPFKSEGEYLASLSASMRSDLKKKMRLSARVQIETRASVEGIEDEIAALFQETRAKRKADYGTFEDVPAAHILAR
jgi:hypothetical protein